VIRAAAAGVFAERGYDEASMREIAQAAGVTTPVLYDHFASKGDLYAATIEMQANVLVSTWIAGDAPPIAPDELFRSTTEAFFRAVSDSDLTWRLLFAQRPRAAEAAAVHDQVQSFASEAIVASLRQLPKVDSPLDTDIDRAYGALAEVVKGAGHALVAWWKKNQDVPIEQIIELNRRLIWGGLGSMVADVAVQSDEESASDEETSGEHDGRMT
jgi:AcrR family transcriptional regulator